MRQIISISQPELLSTPQGNAVKFTIHYNSGAPETVITPATELHNVCAYFLNLNEFLTENGVSVFRGAHTPVIGPLTVHGAGLSSGESSRDTHIELLVGLAAVQLSFRFEREQVVDLLKKLDPISQALSAPSSKRPN